MARLVKAGATDQTVIVRVVDSTDGTPETAVAFNTAGVSLWYKRGATGAKTAITPATQTDTGAHTDGGFVHVGDGYCRLDLPDAAVAAGVDEVSIGGTFTDMVVIGTTVQLAAYNIGTENAPADVIAISGDTTAADNLEAAADGAGYNLGGGSIVAASVTGAVGSVTGAVGSVTGNVGGNVTGSVGSVAAGGITAASIATDAIDADALAADAVAEINATVDTAISDAALATAAALATVDTNVDAILVDTGTTLPATLATAADLATVDTVVDAIKAVTDLLPDGGALTTLLSNVAAILTDTGTTLPASLTAIETDTQDIQSRIPAALTGAGNIKADTLAINASTAAAARLALSAAQLIPGTVSTGTTTATTTEFAASDILEATDDHYNGRLVLWTSGALAGQVTDVTDYTTNGSSEGVFTVTQMTEAPASSDTFLLV